ncbi:hypothetical protein ACQPZX_18755 [Actinoplanes sp. CA-142083]|uniref:hypothetical protein n=1 Tax=Actinoplanes sp. CA-142083 TaxID=3239903 RepID=UPI003D924A3D
MVTARHSHARNWNPATAASRWNAARSSSTSSDIPGTFSVPLPASHPDTLISTAPASSTSPVPSISRSQDGASRSLTARCTPSTASRLRQPTAVTQGNAYNAPQTLTAPAAIIARSGTAHRTPTG